MLKKVDHLKIKRNSQGFTLVEMLVTIVLLVAGCLVALKIMGNTMSASSEAYMINVASFLAESRFEDIKSRAFNEVPFIGAEAPEKLTESGQICPSGSEAACFTRTVTVIPQSPTSRSHEVFVNVAWGVGAERRQVIYNTVITARSF